MSLVCMFGPIECVSTREGPSQPYSPSVPLEQRNRYVVHAGRWAWGEWGDDTSQRLTGVDTGTGRGDPTTKRSAWPQPVSPSRPFTPPRPKTPAWSEPNKIAASQDGVNEHWVLSASPQRGWVHEGRELLGQQGSVAGMCVCGSANKQWSRGKQTQR